MIRTNVVELTVIPAVAYRQKLQAGGSGITILRYGEKQPAIASISKTSGKPILSANTPKNKYPEEAFEEAMRLTMGLPYRKQGKVTVLKKSFKEVEEKKEEPVVFDMADYEKIVAHYTDKSGKLSYELLNKDLIRFANSSSVVRQMIADRKSAAAIKNYVVSTKFRNITDNHDLTGKQLKEIVQLLDNVHPKGVFKELNDKIRQELGKGKK